MIVLLGNHEAEFLANPDNKRADAFRMELAAAGIQPLPYRPASIRSARG